MLVVLIQTNDYVRDTIHYLLHDFRKRDYFYRNPYLRIDCTYF